MRSILILLLLLLPLQTFSADKIVKFKTQEQEQRYKKLIQQLRCLVCQNQNIADSNAELAVDLRNIVQEKIRKGESDVQITGYLVQRYGDFVLYKPRIKPSTWLLWFGPFVLLALAIFLLLRKIQRNNQTVSADISEEEQARIEAMLKDKKEDKDQ